MGKALSTVDLPEPTRSADAQTADLTVVGGAGHVGIPLVLSFAAKGVKVNVNDLNVDSLACLRSGRLPFIEYGAEEMLADALRRGRLTFTSKPSEISKSGPVIITIGTPIDEFMNPERHVVKQCIDALVPFLRKGQLLVLRSTLYPGTTDWISNDLERMGLGLKVAFCPERIVQGYGVDELASMPQIVSGTTPEAAEEAAALFRTVAQREAMVLLDARFLELRHGLRRRFTDDTEPAVGGQTAQLCELGGRERDVCADTLLAENDRHRIEGSFFDRLCGLKHCSVFPAARLSGRLILRRSRRRTLDLYQKYLSKSRQVRQI
jgi:UDP-glucose/GDP-mannose dehydrogenase family, NAD binding domain